MYLLIICAGKLDTIENDLSSSEYSTYCFLLINHHVVRKLIKKFSILIPICSLRLNIL